MSRKSTGIVLIVLGFIGVGVAGLWLAGQAAQGSWNGRDLMFNAVAVFVPVTLLVGAGIFLYMSDKEAPEPSSMVYAQRQLMDILNSRRQVTFDEVAVELDISPQMVRELLALEVFGGEVDWECSVLYARHRND